MSGSHGDIHSDNAPACPRDGKNDAWLVRDEEGETKEVHGWENEVFEPDEQEKPKTGINHHQTDSTLSEFGEQASKITMNSATTSSSPESVQVIVKPLTDVQNSDEESVLDFADEVGDVLPSQQYRSLRGLPAENHIKRKMRPTLRSITSSVSLYRTIGERNEWDQEDGTVDRDTENELLQSMNFTPEEYAQLLNRARSIKEMPTSIRRKRSIQETLVTEGAAKVNIKQISSWTHFKLTLAMKWQHFRDNLGELFYSLELWRGALKEIQGHFGSGVLSYFIFLRWLFLLNMVILALTVLLLFIPQITFLPSYRKNNVTFTGWEFLTGEGWFTKTEMYYGTYTNQSIPVSSATVAYNMPLAYLCVGGGYLLLCLLILVYSMASSYRDNYIYSGDEFSYYTTKVFCAWDYGIEDESTAKLKKKSIYNDFKEILSDDLYKEERTLGQECCLYTIRIVTNIVVIALLGGTAYLIYYCSRISLQQSATIINKLLLPLVVSGLNVVLPFVFRIIASLENYEKPRTALQISLARTIVLKLCSLAVVLVSLYFDVTKCRRTSNTSNSSSDDKRCDRLIKNCWENYIGFAFYRLTIVDFVFLLLSTFFGEFVRRLIAVRQLGPPVFDISRNVLDLIYGQSLCWIGVFYSPLLSVICVIKLAILFYVKKISVMQNCRPSMRPFRASKMNLLFLVLLGIAFVVALIAIGYTVMTKEVMTPSTGCGPFRDKDYMFEVFTSKVSELPDWIGEAVEVVSSAGVLSVIFCILGITTYYYKMLKNSNEKKIQLLKDQIAMAGRDKLFLLKRIKATQALGRPHQD